MIQPSQVPLVEVTPHANGQRASSSCFHAIGTSVIEFPVDPLSLIYDTASRQPIQSTGDPRHATSEHAPHSAPTQDLFPTHLPPLVHHQSTSFPLEDTVPSTSLQPSMDILSNPPASLSPFPPDPSRGIINPPPFCDGIGQSEGSLKEPTLGDKESGNILRLVHAPTEAGFSSRPRVPAGI